MQDSVTGECCSGTAGRAALQSLASKNAARALERFPRTCIAVDRLRYQQAQAIRALPLLYCPECQGNVARDTVPPRRPATRSYGTSKLGNICKIWVVHQVSSTSYACQPVPLQRLHAMCMQAWEALSGTRIRPTHTRTSSIVMIHRCDPVLLLSESAELFSKTLSVARLSAGATASRTLAQIDDCLPWAKGLHATMLPHVLGAARSQRWIQGEANGSAPGFRVLDASQPCRWQSDVGLACASPRALTSCTQLSGTHPNATSVLLRSHCRRGDPRIAGKQHTRVFMVVVALRAVDHASRTKAEGMVGNTTE